MDISFYIIIGAALLVVVVLLIIRNIRASKRVKKVKSHLRAGTHAAAISELQQILLDNPDDLQSLYTLAKLELKSDHAYDALQNVNRLLERNLEGSGVSHVDAVVLAAEAALACGRMKEGYDFLLMARGLDKTNVGVNVLLAEYVYGQGLFDKAAGYARTATKLEPGNIKANLYHGLAWFALKDMEKAAASLSRVLELDARNFQALYALGCLYGRRRQVVDAEPFFESAIRNAQNRAQKAKVYFEWGQAAKSVLQLDKAQGCFLQVKELDPNAEIAVMSLLELGDIYEQKQEIGAMVEILRQYVARRPADTAAKARLEQYAELDNNSRLQRFTLQPDEDFTEICQKISRTIAVVDTIHEVQVQKNGMVDILASRTSKKSNSMYMLRYLRTTGKISDMLVRDLYAKGRAAKVERSFFVTNGTFTDAAVDFASSRVVTLIEKEKLIKYLDKTKF